MPQGGACGSGFRRLAVFGAWALMAGCLGCCVLYAATSRGSGLAGTSTGLSVEGCVGFVTTPRLQFGVSLTSPLSSYLPPLAYSRYALCGYIPPSVLPSPPYGEWLFPP